MHVQNVLYTMDEFEYFLSHFCSGFQQGHYSQASTGPLLLGLNRATTPKPQQGHYSWVSTGPLLPSLNWATTPGSQQGHYSWASTGPLLLGLNRVSTPGSLGWPGLAQQAHPGMCPQPPAGAGRRCGSCVLPHSVQPHDSVTQHPAQ